MSVSTTITESCTAGGVSFNESKALTADGVVAQQLSIAAGNQSTAWDLDTGGATGTATLASGHGITTAEIVDVYWSTGARLGVTVGTVSGTSVPLTDSGSGDALPADDTTVTISARTNIDFQLDGDNMQALFMATTAKGTFALAGVDDATDMSKTLSASVMYVWYDGCGEDNPISGDTVTQAFLSNSSTSAITMKIAAFYNN
jgi:hypothetical protein